MDQRQVVVSQSSTNEPVRRTIVRREAEVDSVPRARVAPLRVPVQEVSPTAARRVVARGPVADNIVLEHDKPYTGSSQRVTIGDVVGSKLDHVAQDLRHRAPRLTKLEETIHAKDLNPFHRVSPRTISVGYMRATKPAPAEFHSATEYPDGIRCYSNVPFTEEEIREHKQNPKLRIHYPDGAQYGEYPYIEMTDDTYATAMENELGVTVDICHKGMSLLMSRHREDDHWKYWPLDREYNLQNLPLRGKVTDSLYEANSTMFDLPMEPIVHEYDDENAQPFVLVMEYLPKAENYETGEIKDDGKFAIAIVVDTEGVTRVVEIPHAEELFV